MLSRASEHQIKVTREPWSPLCVTKYWGRYVICIPLTDAPCVFSNFIIRCKSHLLKVSIFTLHSSCRHAEKTNAQVEMCRMSSGKSDVNNKLYTRNFHVNDAVLAAAYWLLKLFASANLGRVNSWCNNNLLRYLGTCSSLRYDRLFCIFTT